MWNELSMKDKADLMKLGIKNGIRDLDTIRSTYNKYGDGGYISSPYIRHKITKWEGTSMRSNKPFNTMDKDFNDSIPSEVRSKMSQAELDALYSYAYNVGTGNFRKRVIPALNNLYNGTGTLQSVQQSMWSKGDTKYRGLRNRRNTERSLFGDAYSNHYQPVSMNNLDNFNGNPNDVRITPFLKPDVDPVGNIPRMNIANTFKPLQESVEPTPEENYIQPLSTYDLFNALSSINTPYKLVNPVQPISTISMDNT